MESSDRADHRLVLAQPPRALTIPRIVEELQKRGDLQDCITHVEFIPAKEAQFADFPEGLDQAVRQLFRQRGIERLYSHQAQSIQQTLAGKNVVVVTPTA